jgi:hypothetical protein
MFFANRPSELDVSAAKISHLYDDIRTDIVELMEINASISNQDNITTVTLNETFPSPMIPNNTENYISYIRTNFTKRVGRQMEVKEGSLAGADIRMDYLALEDANLEILPHNYIIDYSGLDKKSVVYYPQNNQSNLLSFSTNLSFDIWRGNVSESTVPGNLTVSIYAYYDNYSYSFESDVSRYENSSWLFRDGNDSMAITIGSMPPGNDSISNSILLDFSDNLNASVSNSLRFNQSVPVSIWSDFGIRIIDILGDTDLESRLWFIKE